MAGLRPMMRRSVDWACAGLPSDGPWNRLFYLAMVYGATQTRVFPRVFTREELARIEAPCLLLVGEREKIYRAEAVRQAALRLMPSVEVEIVPRAHHIAAVAQPDAVNTRLLAFLARPHPRHSGWSHRGS